MKRIILLFAVLMALAMAAVSVSFAADTVMKTDIVSLREEWQTEDEPCSSEQIFFEILDGSNAILTDRMIESDSMYYDTVRKGTYTLTELGYEFLSPQPYGVDEWYACVVVPDAADPGRIEGITVEFLDYSTKEVAGTYKGTSARFGEASLEIKETGSAVLKASDGNSYSGSFSAYNAGWDFFPEVEDGYEDYYVELSGNTFTIMSFTDKMYGEYEGTYTAEGDLGTMSFTVASDGSMETNAVIEGVEYRMTGMIYVDDTEQKISGCWLTDENGIDLNLAFEKLFDGTLNYYGSYSKQLAAG